MWDPPQGPTILVLRWSRDEREVRIKRNKDSGGIKGEGERRGERIGATLSYTPRVQVALSVALEGEELLLLFSPFHR